MCGLAGGPAWKVSVVACCMRWTSNARGFVAGGSATLKSWYRTARWMGRINGSEPVPEGTVDVLAQRVGGHRGDKHKPHRAHLADGTWRPRTPIQRSRCELSKASLFIG